MMESEIADIMFLIRTIKFPSDHFNINNFVEFSYHKTRAATYCTLFVVTHLTETFISIGFLACGILCHLLTLASPSTIKTKLRHYFWDKFMTSFDCNVTCSYHYLCPCTQCFKTASEHALQSQFSIVSIYLLVRLLA